jgi:hypothetical protein
MSRLGNYVTAQIEREKAAGKPTTAKSMAHRMGIKGSMLSRFQNDPNRGLHPKTLAKMVRGISDDPEIQAGLLAAFLEDQLAAGATLTPEVSQLVFVQLSKRATRTTEEPDRRYGGQYERLSKVAAAAALDTRSLRAIETIIAGCRDSVPFRRSVRDLADIAERHVL